MKKYNCLLALLVSVFLLFCACVQEQANPTSSPTQPTNLTGPSSSTQSNPTSAPTQPSIPTDPPTSQPNLDWVTTREIVPFEDRFKEDVPFGDNTTTWIASSNDSSSNDYNVFRLQRSSITIENGKEKECVYNIPVDEALWDYCYLLSADGRWAYVCSGGELCKLDLLSGELTTLVEKRESDLYWQVQACGKDTVCIFQLDVQRNLRIYYRDLHSDAEKTLYSGVLPQTSAYDLQSGWRGLSFRAPSSTLGTFTWQMMNPAFYAASQEELANPDSQFKRVYQEDYSRCWEDPEKHPIHLASCPALCNAIQDELNTPYYIKYICDPVSGTVTEDYGIIDRCFYGTGLGHNHFDYEITKEETPEILDVAPVEIPNISKASGVWPEADSIDLFIYSDFGGGHPYLALGDSICKLADIPVTEAEIGSDFVYCITTEGAIVQISYDGKICNTIYTSYNELRNLFYWQDALYFIDGNTIVCIDTIAGTYCPIIRTTLKEMNISSAYDNGLHFYVRQGLYFQEYIFSPYTGELTEFFFF